MENSPIYLDYNATTPVDPQVLEAMMPYFHTCPGNANSVQHRQGKEAADAVESAREEVANLIGCSPPEIIFTSGATESINLAIKGANGLNTDNPYCLITSSIEHKAVLETCLHLEKQGVLLTILPVLQNGLLDWSSTHLEASNHKGMIAIHYANNETGTIQDASKVYELAKSQGLAYFSDATQAVGKIEVNPKNQGMDLMAFSGHKLYGPKGIGALFINTESAIQLNPLTHGGNHENGIRAGTLNVPAIVGFGKACSIASHNLLIENQRIELLRHMLLNELMKIDGAVLNGHPTSTLPNTLNISFQNVSAIMLIEAVQSSLSVSTGSACSSAMDGPSHVLEAMGLSQERIRNSIRISLGRFTTKEEINKTGKTLRDTIVKLRN